MSLHIQAEQNQIADRILLPGDPLRAKWIAEKYLENVICYNQQRGMLGFTGYYKGERISVQGTGMGLPSFQIYAHELINDYGIKKMIRVGSAGAYQPYVKVNDIIVAMSASTDSSLNRRKFGAADFAPTASFSLFNKAIKQLEGNQDVFHAGNILSTDIFYDQDPLYFEKWASYNVLGVEMETAALYTFGNRFNVEALSILTVSDSLVTGESLPSKDREQSFNKMAELALETIIL
ncbi:MAG: purine-nucleoside phosphorylase [Flavobacteriales bacterium]